MEDKTKKFLRKIKFDTYIYTVMFAVISVFYFLVPDMPTAPVILLLSAFAFYTVGRQINLISQLELGAEIDTRPKAPLWVRFVTYLVIILSVISVIFGYMSVM